MAELTLQAIRDLLDTKFDEKFGPLGVKTDKTAVLVSNLVENLSEVPATLRQIQETLNSHTAALDAIVKNTANWNAEMETMRHRMEKYEKAIKLVASKMNLGKDIEEIIAS